MGEGHALQQRCLRPSGVVDARLAGRPPRDLDPAHRAARAQRQPAGDQLPPGFETGIESALDTDTFHSIFRGAIRTAHADLLHGGSGGGGINLSQSVSEALTVVTDYGEALLSQPAEATATTDAVYAPWLVEVLTSYIKAAPKELAARAEPMLDRATAAMTATGLDQAGADDVVAAGRQTLAAQADIDGPTLQTRLQATFLQHVKQDALDAATKELGPTPGDLFVFTDLGFVDPDVASKAGTPACSTDRRGCG